MFPTTRWTLITGAKESPEARAAAWRHLLTTYWPPLFAFFRSKGLDAAAAADAVQGLCAELLERGVVDSLSPERGRLRGFLKVAAQNHLFREHEKATAQRRGSGAAVLELDLAVAERVADPALQPDAAFERAWAQQVFARAMARLRAEWTTRAGDFEVIERFFTPTGTTPAYRDVAEEKGLSIAQLKSLLHRARLEFKKQVEAEVRETVQLEGVDAEPQVLAAEVKALMEALA